MMDIYDFFCSDDIAAHCKAINHQFSPLDMACIVYISDKPLRQKHAAYRYIIDNLPDEPIRKRFNFEARESLHEYLRELMSYEERGVQALTGAEDGYVFCARVTSHSDKEIKGCFSTFEKATAAVRDFLDFGDDFRAFVAITKKRIDGDISQYEREVVTDRYGEIIRTEYYEEPYFDTLDMIFFHLPLPFVKGDLITDGYPHYMPAILTWLPHFPQTHGPQYDWRIAGTHSDGSDMNYYYSVMEGGELKRAEGHGYWNLRYFKGEFKGEKRFLKHMSKFIKEKSDGPEDLIIAFLKYRADFESEWWGDMFKGLWMSRDE